MINLEDLQRNISKLPKHKQLKVLKSYQYNNLSIYNKIQHLLSKVPKDERKELLNTLPPNAILALVNDWRYRGRPDQLCPPGDWRNWVNCAGRSAGKSISGIQFITQQAITYPDEYLIVGRSKDDALEKQLRPILANIKAHGIDMAATGCVDMRTGILRLPNGSTVYAIGATTIDEAARGYNASVIWLDEIGSYPDAEHTYNLLMYALRLGRAQIYISTTPKVSGTANSLLRKLIADPHTVYTSTNAYANLDNLNEHFIETLLSREGTRVCEEEVWAEVIEDAGAMWSQSMFDVDGFRCEALAPDKYDEIVIGYDPAGKDINDEHGVMVVGKRKSKNSQGYLEDHFYVLGDYSDKLTPTGAAELLSRLFHEYKANKVVCEVNNGWDWIPTVINGVDSSVVVECVTASRGKVTRAEPILALYEQCRVHHIEKLGSLEAELISFSPSVRKSPNRVDSLVWSITGLTSAQHKVVAPQPFPLYLGF